MGKYLWGFSLLLVILLSSGYASAQIADPNCYYPDFNNKSQVDTIYGSYSDQQLGDFFRLPPAPGTKQSRLALGDIREGNARYSVVDPSTKFNLHSPNIADSLFMWRQFNLHSGVGGALYGHFRNSKDLDLLEIGGTTYIYWADENGLYDTSRKTALGFDFKNYNGGSDGTLPPIITRFSSDTVDDIFYGVTTITIKDSIAKDTCFLVHYSGGIGMKIDLVRILPDIKFLFDTVYDPETRDFITGDFRGTGNKDIIGYHRLDNLFFYRNVGKFDPTEFIRAMHEDTLLAAWQQHLKEKNINDNKLEFGDAQAVRVLTKPDFDSSIDLIFMYILPDPNGGQGTVGRFAFLKGGPDFGSNRILLDTVTTIRDLGTLNSAYSNYSPYPNFFIGQVDRSSKANKFILIHYGEEVLYHHYYLYMLGDAFDDQADMIFEVPYPFFDIYNMDTVDANGDKYSDILFGAQFYTSSTSNLSNVGTMGIIYGSSLIPHQIKNAVTEAKSFEEYCRVLTMPEKKVRVEYSMGQSGQAEVLVRDVLGRLVQQKWIFLENKGSFTLDLSTFPQGTYFLSLEGSQVQLDNKFVISY